MGKWHFHHKTLCVLRMSLFHTVHGVLVARILKWFAIPFSSGPCSVRTLHHVWWESWTICMDGWMWDTVMYGHESWTIKKAEELMLWNCGVGEDSRVSLGLQGDPASTSWRRSVLGVHWKDRCCSWNSSTLATSCKELTHWKRPWCWEGFGVWGEGDNRGWDGWMASPTQWTCVWVNSASLWQRGRPGVLWFMGSQRVGHDWVTELNWTEEQISHIPFYFHFLSSPLFFWHCPLY